MSVLFIIIIALMVLFALYVIKEGNLLMAAVAVLIFLVSIFITNRINGVNIHTPSNSTNQYTQEIQNIEHDDNGSEDVEYDGANDDNGSEDVEYDGAYDDASTVISVPNTNSDKPEEPKEDSPIETNLTSLKKTTSNNYIRIDNHYDTDNYENTYTNGPIISNTGASLSSGTGIAEFILNGKYKTLKGTLYVPYESRGNSYRGSSLFRIYGDDQLLYNGPSIEGKDAPVDFIINVEGIEFLKVMINGGTTKMDGSMVPSICAGNLILSTLNDTSIEKNTSLPKVYLGDIKIYNNDDLFFSYIDDYLTDIDNNKYFVGDVIANDNSTCFVEYHIKGEFSTLKGTAYIPTVSIGKEFELEPKICVYADDELKTTLTLDSKDHPEVFSADISGAEFLRIEVSGGWNQWYDGYGLDWVPAICIGNACLY